MFTKTALGIWEATCVQYEMPAEKTLSKIWLEAWTSTCNKSSSHLYAMAEV